MSDKFTKYDLDNPEFSKKITQALKSMGYTMRVSGDWTFETDAPANVVFSVAFGFLAKKVKV